MNELLNIAPSFSFIKEKGFTKSSSYYLLEEFGNADVVMDGPEFSFRFERDRGQVFVNIGTAEDGWEKLEYALIFVDTSIDETKLGTPPEVQELANLTKLHWQKISQLYSDSLELSAFKVFCQEKSNIFISKIFSKSLTRN